MMTFVLAVALSLKSANDYVFINPSTTNIIGIGVGESLDHRIPRQEDFEFLREAYAERVWLNLELRKNAETNLNPSSSEYPMMGVDTNSIPSRYKFIDNRLYFYYKNYVGGFSDPSECKCDCLIGYSSPTISSMVFVTNVSINADPTDAFPSMFVPRGVPIAERNFSRCFRDGTYDLKTLAFISAPLTNAYHDIDSNNALTFYQCLRQKTGIKTVTAIGRQYTTWPTYIDQSGNVDYRQREDVVQNNFNTVEYAESLLQEENRCDVTKCGFSYFHNKQLIGGDDGIEYYIRQSSTTPLSTMTITFSNPIGGAEILEAKTFAVVDVSHVAYVMNTNIYNRHSTTLVPVTSSTPYTNENGHVSIDVSINSSSVFSQARSITGENRASMATIYEWVPESERPTEKPGLSGYVMKQGITKSGRDTVRCSINLIIGFVKMRYHARTEESQ